MLRDFNGRIEESSSRSLRENLCEIAKDQRARRPVSINDENNGWVGSEPTSVQSQRNATVPLATGSAVKGVEGWTARLAIGSDGQAPPRRTLAGRLADQVDKFEGTRPLDCLLPDIGVIVPSLGSRSRGSPDCSYPVPDGELHTPEGQPGRPGPSCSQAFQRKRRQWVGRNTHDRDPGFPIQERVACWDEAAESGPSGIP